MVWSDDLKLLAVQEEDTLTAPEQIPGNIKKSSFGVVIVQLDLEIGFNQNLRLNYIYFFVAYQDRHSGLHAW